MHHKRRRPKNARAGCLYCKSHKGNGVSSREGTLRATDLRRIDPVAMPPHHKRKKDRKRWALVARVKEEYIRKDSFWSRVFGGKSWNYGKYLTEERAKQAFATAVRNPYNDKYDFTIEYK